MMAKRDYYEVLGIGKDANEKAIKSAYRKLARQYHPDIAEDKAEAEVKFQEINEAYEVLGDTQKRQQYDQFGFVGDIPGGGDPFSGFGGFGDLFDNLFDFGFAGGARRQPRGPRKGADYQTAIAITLKEAYLGTEKSIELESDVTCETCDGKRTTAPDGVETCSTCHGQGQVQTTVSTPLGRMTQVGPCAACGGRGEQVTKPCKSCSGRGVVRKKRTIAIKVPAGVEQGTVIRVPGEGEPGTMGGPSGHLYVTIHVEPNTEFQRKGSDLYTHLKVSFTDAALGAKVPVPTLVEDEEEHFVLLAAGTQNGELKTVKGLGMPKLGQDRKGDLHLIVQVMVPTSLSKEQKKILQEFAESGSQEWHEQPSLLERLKDCLFG